MTIALNQTERRILGVLLEKQLAQPTYYPMTVSALLAGCNQKSNRAPVLELEEGEVQLALDHLRQRGLVDRLLPSAGSRSVRWSQEISRRFNWSKQNRAVIAELLLRGPQTVGELRTRCSRLTRFEDLAAVEETLDRLREADPPLVVELPREPGRSANRWMHRLCTEKEWETLTRSSSQPPAGRADPAIEIEVAQLREEVKDLRETVAGLEAAIGEISSRLQALK